MPPFLEETHTVDEFDFPPQTGFTSSLMNTIVVSKSKFNDWVGVQKAKIDKDAETYRQQLEHEQQAIDALVTNLLGVQLERGLNFHPVEGNGESHNQNNSNRKKSLEDERQSLTIDIENLQSEFIIRKQRVQDIAMEESKQNLRAREARSLKERVQEAKQTTVDDLTRGIVNYKYLGLDFQKTDGENELRFFFSELDPTDPSRQFSFILQVDEMDRYDLCHCEPAIDATILMEVTNHLNKKDDMGYLVRKMRRSFLETL